MKSSLQQCKSLSACVKRFLKKRGFQKMVLFAFIFLITLMFFNEVKTVIFVSVLFVLATLSIFYTRLIGFSVGFELRTLLFVIVCMKVSVIWGLSLCIISILLGNIIAFNFKATFIATPLAYIFLAALMPFLTWLDIATVGVIITFGYNIILHGMYYFVFNYPVALSVGSLIGNLIINTYIFLMYAETIAGFI